jgi:Mrp family chromosome partitioning ATPase
MARFLDSMKAAENGHPPATAPASTPSLPPPQSLTLVTQETSAEEPVGQGIPDDEPAVPFIEVGPARSIEASPDVLAFRPVSTTAPPVSLRGVPAVAFHPIAAPIEAAPGIAADVVAFHRPDDPVSGQYGDLLTSIVQSLTARAATTLYTGAATGVGTTTVVLNLAVTAARRGRRVVVVDTNTRRPAIAARLALCDRPGVCELLAGSAGLEDVLQETEQAGLAAITAGGPAAVGYRTAEAYRSLWRQLRQRFDLVLVDGPRWDARVEVTGPGSACDAAFLVVAAGSENTAAVQHMLRQMPAHGLRVAGCISANR